MTSHPPQFVDIPSPDEAQQPGLESALGPKRRRRLNASGIEGLSLLAGAILWELLGRFANLEWLPPLSAVLGSMGEIIEDGALGAIASTSWIFLLGMFVTVLTAAVTTTVFVLVPWVYRLARPYFYIAMAVPPLAVVPFFMLIWGPTLNSRIATVWLFAYFVMTIMATEALEHPPREMRDMAESFGGRRLRILAKVSVPAAMPRLLEALRIGVVRGIKGAVNAELIIGIVGVGKLLRAYAAAYDIEQLYAIVLLILILALAAYFLIQQLEQRVSRWEQVR